MVERETRARLLRAVKQTYGEPSCATGNYVKTTQKAAVATSKAHCPPMKLSICLLAALLWFSDSGREVVAGTMVLLCNLPAPAPTQW